MIAIATEGDEEIAEVAADVISMPQNLDFLQPIPAVVALQLFACAIERGCAIDQPRNLAKSVSIALVQMMSTCWPAMKWS